MVNGADRAGAGSASRTIVRTDAPVLETGVSKTGEPPGLLQITLDALARLSGMADIQPTGLNGEPGLQEGLKQFNRGDVVRGAEMLREEIGRLFLEAQTSDAVAASGVLGFARTQLGQSISRGAIDDTRTRLFGQGGRRSDFLPGDGAALSPWDLQQSRRLADGRVHQILTAMDELYRTLGTLPGSEARALRETIGASFPVLVKDGVDAALAREFPGSRARTDGELATLVR